MLIVNKATPTITWATPAPITYGTPLSATQLNATASVPGPLVYTPATGTALSAGSQTISVTFTPTDATDYAAVTQTVTLIVNKATPTITWATPAPITYGTPLSATQLNATASVPGPLVYTPATGTALSAGSQTLSVTFTPTDATDYAAVTQTVTLIVNKATPTITWATPAPIIYGTPLSATQLNATASVPGTFAYIPPAGTVLNSGSQTLSVTFTPTDTTDYTTATQTVTLTVNQAPPNISSVNPTSGQAGTAVTLTGSNFGATQASSTVTFNGVPSTASAWSATSITTAVPNGAGTGNVVVTVGGLVSNGVHFTVPAPSITSLSPTSGSPGVSITITGTNFGTTQGSSTVTFNGLAATPTSWSTTKVVTTVPSGARTGNVVMTVGAQASNGASFTVPAPSITSLVADVGIAGHLGDDHGNQLRDDAGQQHRHVQRTGGNAYKLEHHESRDDGSVGERGRAMW